MIPLLVSILRVVKKNIEKVTHYESPKNTYKVTSYNKDKNDNKSNNKPK
jgi:hypothetical protein